LQNIQQLKIDLLTSAKSFVALFFHGADLPIIDGYIEEVDQVDVIQVMEEQEGFLAYW
jgi:hypothetical protein